MRAPGLLRDALLPGALAGLVGGQIIFHFGYPAASLAAAATTAIAAGAQYRLFRRDDPHPGLRGVFLGLGTSSTRAI